MTERQRPRVLPETDAKEEPIVYGDDAVIGRALRISLVGALAIGAIATTVWLLLPGPPPPKPTPETKVTGPAEAPPRPAPTEAVLPTFTRVTESAGVDFVRTDGADGRKLLPETMGGGVAIADFNGDGTLDLALVDGDAWPDAPEGSVRGQGVVMYMNDGALRFIRAADPVLATPGSFMGLTTADIDADGRVDLLVTGVHGVRLYRNITESGSGVRFEDITAKSGLAVDRGWSTSAGFADFDGDGDLDLLLPHYVEWSPEIDARVDYRLAGVGRAYGPPNGFPGTRVSYYEQVSPLAFVDKSVERGLDVRAQATNAPVAKSLGLAIVDIDDDGDLDALIANDQVRKFVFVNDGTGRFQERGVETGFAYDRVGAVTGAMGIDAARIRNDGATQVAIGNFANEPSGLYATPSGSIRFTDDAIVEGVSAATRPFLTFGLLFADLNLDGKLDFVQANGHIEDQIERAQKNQSYRQRAQAFVQADGLREVPPDASGDLALPLVGRGMAWGDLDGDGDLDLVIAQSKGPPSVLRNDVARSPDRSWVGIALRQPGTANIDAIGATVTVDTDAGAQQRVIMPVRSYLSAVPAEAWFGVPAGNEPVQVTVRWPDGTVQKHSVLRGKRSTLVRDKE